MSKMIIIVTDSVERDPLPFFEELKKVENKHEIEFKTINQQDTSTFQKINEHS